jgi:hypothetical protein
MTGRALESVGASWTDLGNWIENSYSENEMLEAIAAARQDGIQEGIKIGKAQTQAQAQNNGHIVLPEPSEMAEYCHDRLSRLKDDKQRDFVRDMHTMTQQGIHLSRGRLGYLASIYIQIGGRI